MLGGRVKTLHPRVHAGILARRDREEDIATLDREQDRPVRPRRRQPLPVYERPGRRADRRRRAGNAPRRRQELRVRRGGLRSRRLRDGAGGAPRNRRDLVRDEAHARGQGFRAHAPRTTRRSRAGSRQTSRSQSGSAPSFVKELDLAYGENPHQRAAYYRGPGQHLLSDVEKLHGRDLSFINLYDLAAAVGLLVGARRRARVRDRQARQPVRRRGCGHDRARPTSSPMPATRSRPLGWSDRR